MPAAGEVQLMDGSEPEAKPQAQPGAHQNSCSEERDSSVNCFEVATLK